MHLFICLLYLYNVYFIQLHQQCPRGDGYECRCEQYRLDMVPGKPLTVSVRVDCSNNQLIALPLTLPQNTILLNVTNNNVSLHQSVLKCIYFVLRTSM